MPPKLAPQPSQATSPASIARGLSVLIQHAKNEKSSASEPTFLSHYREIPENIVTAYGLTVQGAQLVKATATKYALIGAIDTKDQGSLGADLLKGCELIGAAIHATTRDSCGCARAVQHYNQKAALSVYIATLRLVQAFHPELVATSSGSSNPGATITSTISAIGSKTVATTGQIATKENTVGAQKTGAVWEACDHITNKMLPQGNRNAMRRELFTWTRECNDTMEEFEELIEMGPKEKDEGENDNEADEGYACFGGLGGDDQYSEEEMPIARACLGLLKNSRGNMKITMETCEALGKKLETDNTNESQTNKEHLEAILKIHQHARKVGEGVTDLGSLMYPPLLPQSTDDLKSGVRKQVAFIVGFQDYILGLEPHTTAKITELSNTLKTAAQKREKEFLEALESYEDSTE